MKKILIFEPFTTGHRLDHIRHLVRFAKLKLDIRLVLLVAPHFDDDIENENNVSVIRMSNREYNRLNKSNFQQSIWQYIILYKYIKFTGIKTIYSDSIDMLYNILAFQVPFPKDTNLSGILYRGDFHYDKVFGEKSLTITARLNKFRKKILLTLAYKHKNLKNIFSHDEIFTVTANKQFSSQKTSLVPDPTLFYPENIPKHSKFKKFLKRPIILSFFGHIDKRKGVLQFLNSLKDIKIIDQEKITVIIAGKVDTGIRSEIKEIIDYIVANTNIQVEINDGYISFQDLTYLVAMSDLILAPYVRHPGTSGVILWAAKAKKPVLTQDYGLLGFITKKYKLGYSVDTEISANISCCINHFLKNNGKIDNVFNPITAYQYADGKTPDTFAKAILDRL